MLPKLPHGPDPLISKVSRYIQEEWPQRVDDKLKPYKSKQLELSSQDGCILWGERVVSVLTELHGRHPGVSRMKSLARGFMWWQGLDQATETTV